MTTSRILVFSLALLCALLAGCGGANQPFEENEELPSGAPTRQASQPGSSPRVENKSHGATVEASDTISVDTSDLHVIDPADKDPGEGPFVEEVDRREIAERILSISRTDKELITELERLEPGIRSYSVFSHVFRSLSGSTGDRDTKLAKAAFDWFVGADIVPPYKKWTQIADLVGDLGRREPDRAMELLASAEGAMRADPNPLALGNQEFGGTAKALVDYYFDRHDASSERILATVEEAGFSADSRILFVKLIEERNDR